MFSALPVITYPYDGGVEIAAIVKANLPRRLGIDRSYIFQQRFVKDGETPEALANELYSRPDLDWVVMYINSVRCPWTEWPMPDHRVKEYADAKYGVDSQVELAYLLDTRNNRRYEPYEILRPYPLHITPVSYFLHEQTANNARRDIRIIAPKYILDFVDLYNDLIKGRVA